MLRKSSIRRIMLATLALFLLLIIYFFPTTPSISESLSYIEKEEMPIFLVDNMEYIARTSIVKNSDNNFIEVIDLPFLYSTIKYKYDVVGARNLMNT